MTDVQNEPAATDESELEDGQEICPVCGAVNWPGAEDVCSHYLWNHWDNEIIWAIPSGSDLVQLAMDFVNAIHEATYDDKIAYVLTALSAAGQTRYEALAKMGAELNLQAVLDHESIQVGKTVVTAAMIGGSGHSEYSSEPAEMWVEAELAKLKSALTVVRNVAD